MSSFETTQTDPELPPVDERLVEPGTRHEMLDGELIYVPPADPPHATRHSKVLALVEAHAASAFEVACDMLTRTSKIDDIAPDVSVFPRARDPRTGRRQLEHLAFEVVSTSSLTYAGRKARKLATRGVRRVFAIDIERDRALEWSLALGTWAVLDPSMLIEDPALAAPLAVDALVHTAATDDEVARALLIKRNSVLQEALSKRADRARQQGKAEGLRTGKAEGLRTGKAEALLAMLAARGTSVDPSIRMRILDEPDPARLDRWIARAASAVDLAELLRDD